MLCLFRKISSIGHDMTTAAAGGFVSDIHVRPSWRFFLVITDSRMNAGAACEWHVGVCFAFKYSINHQWNKRKSDARRKEKEKLKWNAKYKVFVHSCSHRCHHQWYVPIIYCLNIHFHKYIYFSAMQCSATQWHSKSSAEIPGSRVCNLCRLRFMKA